MLLNTRSCLSISSRFLLICWATGHAAQIAELEATRTRLRTDRNAGLYDEPDEAEWYRTEYKRLGDEIKALKALPARNPGMVSIPTGRTVAVISDHPYNADSARLTATLLS